jgi:putative transposase
MSRYRRMYVPGGTYFFTVNLAHRGTDTLVRHVDVLREAVRKTKAARPFEIDAWVVMPDHLHCIWTLPERDADFSVRWGAIKARFSMGVRRAGFTPPPQLPRVVSGEFAGVNPGVRVHKGEAGIWHRRF